MIKNKITLNVLANITKNIGSLSTGEIQRSKDSYQRKNTVKVNDKALVVFTGSDINIEEKIKELLELKDQGIHLSLVFSRMGEKILDVSSKTSRDGLSS